MTFYCDIMTKDRVKINWVIHVHQLFGIEHRSLEFLLDLGYSCLLHHHFFYWLHLVLFAVNVVYVVHPDLNKRKVILQHRTFKRFSIFPSFLLSMINMLNYIQYVDAIGDLYRYTLNLEHRITVLQEI